MEKRRTRSAAYQHLLVEKAFSHDMMETFSESDGMHKKLNPFSYNEEILVLGDQLKERFWEIIEEHLTDRQKEIVNLLKYGLTQQEVADKLSVNQSSITKCLSADTVISFVNEEHTIADVYERFTEISNKQILSLNEETEKIFANDIIAVVRGTEKEMIRVVSDSGEVIKTSFDHQFLTDRGWMRLEDALDTKSKLSIRVGHGIEYRAIKNWSSVGMEISYDMEVRGPWHNFLGSGIVIHNSLNGNREYGSGNKTNYGGIVRKVRKVVDADARIKEIMQRISDIRNNNWE